MLYHHICLLYFYVLKNKDINELFFSEKFIFFVYFYLLVGSGRRVEKSPTNPSGRWSGRSLVCVCHWLDDVVLMIMTQRGLLRIINFAEVGHRQVLAKKMKGEKQVISLI